MSDENIELLNRQYRDKRGVLVSVTGFDRVNQRVIFERENYPYLCCEPVWKFQKYYTRVDTGA
ncbi:DUF4222 domain-containing protein [Yersinia enterocolitica]